MEHGAQRTLYARNSDIVGVDPKAEIERSEFLTTKGLRKELQTTTQIQQALYVRKEFIDRSIDIGSFVKDCKGPCECSN